MINDVSKWDKTKIRLSGFRRVAPVDLLIWTD